MRAPFGIFEPGGTFARGARVRPDTLTLLLVNVRQDGVRTSGACERSAPLLGGLRGAICLTPRPTIMSSWSVGVNPYASVAAVLRGEEPGRLGTSNGEGGDLPSWLG